MDEQDSIDEDDWVFTCENCACICFSIDRQVLLDNPKVARLVCAQCGWSAEWDLEYVKANEHMFNVSINWN
jgi:hypothetical protein